MHFENYKSQSYKNISPTLLQIGLDAYGLHYYIAVTLHAHTGREKGAPYLSHFSRALSNSRLAVSFSSWARVTCACAFSSFSFRISTSVARSSRSICVLGEQTAGWSRDAVFVILTTISCKDSPGSNLALLVYIY